MTVTLTIPNPPSVNTCFRNVAGKGRVRTLRYNTWARAATNEIMAQRPKFTDGPVVVDITCKRKRKNEDIDNKIKACLDILVTMAVIGDDKCVQEVRCRWGNVKDAVVVVTKAPPITADGAAMSGLAWEPGDEEDESFTQFDTIERP